MVCWYEVLAGNVQQPEALVAPAYVVLMNVCVCACARVCMCVCVRARACGGRGMAVATFMCAVRSAFLPVVKSQSAHACMAAAMASAADCCAVQCVL